MQGTIQMGQRVMAKRACGTTAANKRPIDWAQLAVHEKETTIKQSRVGQGRMTNQSSQDK